MTETTGRHTHTTLPGLVEAYRKASQEERRSERLPGQRAKDRRWKSMDHRTKIDDQLHALGEHELRASLGAEHHHGRDIIAHLTGQPPDWAAQDDLDSAVEGLQRHRKRIAERLAAVSRGHRS
jgi:hypothetical protein